MIKINIDIHSRAKIKFSPFLLGLILILLSTALFLSLKILQQPKKISCTLEAKVCPDGSSVRRIGPNCEFAACPNLNQIESGIEKNVITDWNIYTNTTNQDSDSSDWKIYVDQTYKFSIKYPPNWIYRNACEGGDPEESYPCFHSPDFEVRPVGILMGNPISGGEIILFVDKTIKRNSEGELIQLPLCPENIDKFQFPCNKLQIEDVEAWRSIVESSDGIPTYPITGNTIRISFVRNGLHFRWTGYYNNQSKNEMVGVFDKMLSTFKFLDQN